MHNLRRKWNDFANERSGTVDYFALTSSHYSLTRVLLPLIEQYVSGKVLDLGSGFGAYFSVLKLAGDEYIGIDLQAHTPNLDIVADGCQLPIMTNSFDVIFCSQVLEHTPEPWHLLNEAYRVLSPEGILILSAPHISYIHAAPEDYYRYTNYGLIFLLRQAGFEQIEIQPCGGILSLLGSVPQSIYLALLPQKPDCFVWIILSLNRFLSYLFVALDDIIDRRKLFALNFVAIARK